jgi:hypothetical protein
VFIKHQLDDGRELLVEKMGRPIVYLDNWAINDISLNSDFRQRFIDIMKRRQGTLRVSVQNIVELLKQTDIEQIESILSLIDSVDAGLINTNFQEVIAKENAIIVNGVDENPSNHLDLIYIYLLAQNWPKHWSVSDFIRSVLKNSSSNEFKESWNQFAKRMESFLNTVRSGKGQVEKSKNRSKATRKAGKIFDRGTRELFQLAFDFVLQNQSMTMSSNEWHDFFHLVVPVAYCDIVLLDKRWATFVAQTKFSYPDIAFVFDHRTIDDFYYKLGKFHFDESFNHVEK